MALWVLALERFGSEPIPVILELPAADARQAGAQLVPRVRPERLDAGGEVVDDRSHVHGLDDHPVASEDRAPL